MIDDTVPFPAAEAAEPGEKDRKPSRRRRGGSRRHKPYPAPAEDAPAPALAAPAAATVSPGAANVSSGPPSRPAVDQRLSLFIDFENIALGVRDAQYKKFDIHLVLQRLIEKGR
ncbi:MAG TPA: hypothetical protein VGO79_05040, partial [Thermoanaerobaculia bacterium]